MNYEVGSGVTKSQDKSMDVRSTSSFQPSNSPIGELHPPS